MKELFRKRIKQGIATLLCLVMVLCLVPTFQPSLAAETETATVSTLADVQGTDIPANFKGYIFEYNKHTFTETSKKGIKVSVYTYGIDDYILSYNLRFKFDDTKLSLANVEGNGNAIVNYGVFGSAFIPGKVTESMLSDAGRADSKKTQLIGAPFAAGGNSSPFIYFTPNMEGETLNKNWFKLDILNPQSIMDTDGSNYLYDFRPLSPGPIGIKFTADEPIHLFDVYFIGCPTIPTSGSTSTDVDYASLDATFLEMYTENEGFPLGYLIQKSGTGNFTLDAPIWVNFPTASAPAAETRAVTVSVYDKPASSAYLTNPTIGIWRVEGDGSSKVLDTIGTDFSASTACKLTGTGVDNGVIQLEDGWYKWTVTPHTTDNSHIGNSGWFEVSGNPVGVNMCAIDINDVGNTAYVIEILDGASAGKATPFADKFLTVIIGGITTTPATGEFGRTTVNANPSGTAQSFAISADGYAQYSQEATFNVNGSISHPSVSTRTDGDGTTIINTIILEPIKTKLTLKPEDGAGAYITVTANPAGFVNGNMSADELPITKKTDASGADFYLPDGDYSYSVLYPAKEIGMGTFSIRNGVVYMNPTGGLSKTELSDTPTTDDVIPLGSTSPNGDKVAGTIPQIALDTITERLYYAVGALDNEANPTQDPTKMEVKVYLKNTKAYRGTFSMKFDTAVFSGIDSVVYNGAVIDQPANYSISVNDDGVFEPINNPTTGAGYHAFEWVGRNYDYVDSTTNPVLIATYTLNLTAQAQADYRQFINSKSLTVYPYDSTAAAATIKYLYGDDTTSADNFLVLFWRAIDSENHAPIADDAHRYDESLATSGGFLQIHENYDVNPQTGAMRGSDVRSQFVFDTRGNAGVVVTVVGPDGEPVVGAEVTITDKNGNEYTGTTDGKGEVTISVPGDEVYDISVDGGAKYEDGELKDEYIGNGGKEVTVELTLNDLHNIRMCDAQESSIALVGPDKIANGNPPYEFNLTPKAGFEWKDGAPSPNNIIIYYEGDKANPIHDKSKGVVTLTWNAAKNKYVLAAGVITKEDISVDVIIEVLETYETDLSNIGAVKVFVNVGTGGGYEFEEFAGNQYTPADGKTALVPGPATMVEDLGAGVSTSAKYTFIPGGRTAEAREAMTTVYEDYVISEFIVNGVSLPLTDNQRIYGIHDFQLLKIMENQTITVTFGKAYIDPGDPNTPTDDIIVPKPGDPDPQDPPIDPVSDAVVSLTVGEYGTATVSVDDTVNDKVEGYGHKDYTSDGTGDLTAVITADSQVEQPEGEPIDYIIDSILVDGVFVYTDGAAVPGAVPHVTFDPETGGAPAYGHTTGTLTIEDDILGTGESHSVIITFKPAPTTENPNPDSIFTIVILKKLEGEGWAAPSNPGNKVESAYATYTFTPDSGYKMGEISLNTVVGSATSSPTLTAGGDANSYTVGELTGGVYRIDYSFTEQTFKVEFWVYYGKMNHNLSTPTKIDIRPVTHATLSFMRTAGGSATPVNDYKASGNITGAREIYTAELPAGTWTITVKKNGYLDYSITGFVINDDGTAVNAVTKSTANGDVICFGVKDTTEKALNEGARPINPTIGDATWDGKLVATNDIAQVANGMNANATPDSKAHGDVDESMKRGDIGVDMYDITCVIAALGRRNTVISYDNFLVNIKLYDNYQPGS